MTEPRYADPTEIAAPEIPLSTPARLSALLSGWLKGVPRWELLYYAAIVALAVITRFWDIGTRAMHHDESIHAFFALEFLGAYEHNPLTHGPFQFFGINLLFNVFGESEVTARGMAAVSGVVVVGLPFFLRNYLGRWVCILASLMLLLSPTLLYFTRFARNDAYMAAWTLLLIIFLWKFWLARKARYLYASAAVLSLAFATKENTFILMVVLVGFFFVLWVKGIEGSSELAEPATRRSPKMAAPRPLVETAARAKAVAGWLCPRIAPYPLAFTLFLAWVVSAIFWSLDIYDVFGRVNLTFSLVSLGVAVGLYLGILPWLTMLRRSRLHSRLEYRRFTNRFTLTERLRCTPWPLLVLLPLPLMGAAVAVFQEPLELTLANPNGFGGAAEHHVPGIPDGAPAGNISLAIALGVTVYLFAVGFYLGVRWDRKKFLIAAAIFWSIFLLLFTTFFTNTAQGLGSGLWQSLGYWVAQQEVRRGAQPWYYYLLMTTAYEFLALTLVLLGAAWLVLKKKATWKPSLLVYQGLFWGITAALVLYSYWMPSSPVSQLTIGTLLMLGAAFNLFTYWFAFDKSFLRSRLLVANLAILLLLVINWAIPRIIEATGAGTVESFDAGRESLNAVTLFVALLFITYKSLTRENRFDAFLVYWLAATLVLYSSAGEKMPWLMVHTALPIILLAARFLGRAIERANRQASLNLRLAAALVGVAVLSLVGFHSTRVALDAAYGLGRPGTGDYPIEMLVYTQTTPDITRTMANIEERARDTGQGFDLPIIIDRTSGFGYPWRWYLRDYANVHWPCYDAETSDATCSALNEAPDAEVIVMHYRNEAASTQHLGDYGQGERIGHRAWFPEFATYKSGSSPLPLESFVGALGDGGAWREWWDWFVNRELADDKQVGSEDAIVFFRLHPEPFESGDER